MFKKSKGFSLIELLIVVAILGILAALLIPSAMTATQKARQKGTMEDMEKIAERLTDFAEENGYVPKCSGIISKCFSYLYLSDADLTIADQWGNPFELYSVGQDEKLTKRGCILDCPKKFLIISFGRDGVCDGTNALEVGSYEIEKMKDFDKDLVLLNGKWISRPISVKQKN